MNENLALKKQILYSSFITRLFAAFIDNLLILLFTTPLFQITSKFFSNQNEIKKLITPTNIENTQTIPLSKIHDIFITYGLLYDSLFKISFIAIVFIFCWSGFSTSPGKKLFSLSIVDQQTLKKPSIKQSIIRFLSYSISIIPLFLGVFWICFNKKRQAWHDKIAGTVVIKN